MKAIYDAYEMLSEGEGLTRADGWKGQKVFNALRDKFNIKPWEIKKIMPIFHRNMKNMRSIMKEHPDSKLAKESKKWMKGDNEHKAEAKKMMEGMFDKFANKDKRIHWDDFVKMTSAMKAMQEKQFGQKMDQYYTDDIIKGDFDIYNSFSEEEGISKRDFFRIARTHKACMHKHKKMMITDVEHDFYYPLADYIFYEFEDSIDDDEKFAKF